MSKLENNTISLQTILNTINNLPEAGAGNTEDLEAELLAQETLITNITTALANKASGGSGGGSVATCTVDMTLPTDFISRLIYTEYTDGEINTVYLMGVAIDDPSHFTLSNIVVGSSIVIIHMGNKETSSANATKLGDMPFDIEGAIAEFFEVTGS